MLIVAAVFLVSSSHVLAATNTNYSDVCISIADANLKSQCKSCMSGGKIWTAIGCIGVDNAGDLTTTFIKLGTGMAGGIAFLLVLFGGFQILTSTGNPEKLQAGQELIGASIAGLLMILLSVFLLRTVGVDILGIPGFK